MIESSPVGLINMVIKTEITVQHYVTVPVSETGMSQTFRTNN